MGQGLVPTLVGLVLALGGPALLASPAHRLLGDENALRTRVIDQLCLLILAALIVAVVLLWEQRPLTSIGWRGFTGPSLAWGIALAGFFMWIVVPVESWALIRLRLGGFATGLKKLSQLPGWFLLFAGLTAGVTEEILFRGYAFDRLAELTGSQIIAGVVTVGLFALVHLRLWGWGPVLAFMVSGGVLTLFYAWQQDLLANIVAHAVVDVVGLFRSRAPRA